MKKLQNITYKIAPVIFILAILILWQIVSSTGIVPTFMLPTPEKVVNAFIKDFSLIMSHTKVTILETMLGLSIGVGLGFVIAVIMDQFKFLHKAIYPVMIITQTIPTIAIAPLLVLWLGYGLTPKIVLIVITSFFPIAVGLLDGFSSADKDAINLMKAMGANTMQRFWHIKLPSAMSYFFAGLRISVSYSVICAVVAEWIGGFNGLGVYMTRVRNAYAFDKMFAVIFFISALSLLLMQCVKIAQKMCMPWTWKTTTQKIDTKE